MRTCREPCRMQLTETDHLWYPGNTPGWKWAPESASLSGTDAQRGTPTETHHHALSQLSGVGSSAERGLGEIPGEERDKVGRQQHFVFSWHDQGGGGEETKVFRGQEEAPWDGCPVHTGIPCGDALFMERTEGEFRGSPQGHGTQYKTSRTRVI